MKIEKKVQKVSGRDLAIFVVLLMSLSLVLVLVRIALWALGMAIAVGALVGAAWLIARVWRNVGRVGEVEAIEAELRGMAGDCAADLGELQLKLLEIGSTKGIGTPLEEQLRDSNELVEELHVKCDHAIRMCRNAPGAGECVEAILHAEEVRAEVRAAITGG